MSVLSTNAAFKLQCEEDMLVLKASATNFAQNKSNCRFPALLKVLLKVGLQLYQSNNSLQTLPCFKKKTVCISG